MDILDQDAVIFDVGWLGSKYSLSIEAKHIGEYSNYDETIVAYKNWCLKNQVFLDLYYIDDHGGVERITDAWSQ